MTVHDAVAAYQFSSEECMRLAHEHERVCGQLNPALGRNDKDKLIERRDHLMSRLNHWRGVRNQLRGFIEQAITTMIQPKEPKPTAVTAPTKKKVSRKKSSTRKK